MKVEFRNVSKVLIYSVIVFPIIWIFIFSLFTNWAFPSIFGFGEFNINIWERLLDSESLLLSGLLLSLIISLITAILSVSLGFATSEVIYKSRYKNTLLLSAYFPYVLSPVVLALLLQVYFVKAGLSGSLIGVIVALFMIVYPYSVLFFVGYWNENLINMKQLVRTLGGNKFSAWTKVVIPVSKPVISLCFFQCFIIAWFEFGLTNLLGVGKVKTLPVQIYMYIQEANPYYAAVASCLMIAPPLFLLFINRRWMSESIKFSPLR
ncbi:ABC transporter permease subunit [Mangrovivirga sp. M17]|uniref:ABC transporter permease subunit n=1 Tax=Mangrovivirga halotolerans TaxID=2993936 RepID=A0ABT3RNT3_9BACT|nr:ABC transporter permease subunit [Mangrovivirga halotolerans]MCX2743462.1 ABC transporter permease subunit [Mangrovivirga halotolerans]